MRGVMGGMSLEEAREVVRRYESGEDISAQQMPKNPPRKGVARLYERLRSAGYGAKDAHFIADQHAAAFDLGIEIEWEEDTGGDRSGIEHDFPLWGVIAKDEDGTVLDSLWGIDLGEVGPDAHHSDPYQWDVEAQVIAEARSELE